MRPVEMERPTIKVFTKPGHGRDETLRQLVFGIEEEGIPCEVSEENFANAMSLAWEASQPAVQTECRSGPGSRYIGSSVQ